MLVRSIHKPFQRLRAAVGLVNSKEGNTVITPSVIACEGRHRHQFDMRNVKISQVAKLLNSRIQRSVRSKRSYVQLVNQRTGQRTSLESRVTPFKGFLIIDARQVMNALRLPLRSGIWIYPAVVIDQVTVVRSSSSGIHMGIPPAVTSLSMHRIDSSIRLHRDSFGAWCPHLKSMHRQFSSFTSNATGKRSKRD